MSGNVAEMIQDTVRALLPKCSAICSLVMCFWDCRAVTIPINRVNAIHQKISAIQSKKPVSTVSPVSGVSNGNV
jgi:hypothetical protein